MEITPIVLYQDLLAKEKTFASRIVDVCALIKRLFGDVVLCFEYFRYLQDNIPKNPILRKKFFLTVLESGYLVPLAKDNFANFVIQVLSSFFQLFGDVFRK